MHYSYVTEWVKLALFTSNSHRYARHTSLFCQHFSPNASELFVGLGARHGDVRLGASA